MAYIRKRNGKFSVEIKRKGIRSIHETFDKKSDAIKFATQKELEIQQSKFKDTSQANKIFLKDLMRERIDSLNQKNPTEKKDAAKLQMMMRYPIVRKTLLELSNSDFAEYRDSRLKSVCGATVNREISLISKLLKTAIDEKRCWLPEFPISRGIRCKENPPKERRLEKGELEKIFEYIDNGSPYKRASIYWKASILFAIESCMRQGEQFTLKWKDIDFEKRTAYLSASITKTKTSRTVPLSSKAIEILRSLPLSIGGNVFPMNKNYISHGFKKITNITEIKGLTWHCFRREGISRLLEKGLSVSEVKRVSGHRTLKAFEIYINHNVEEIARKLA